MQTWASLGTEGRDGCEEHTWPSERHRETIKDPKGQRTPVTHVSDTLKTRPTSGRTQHPPPISQLSTDSPVLPHRHRRGVSWEEYPPRESQISSQLLAVP